MGSWGSHSSRVVGFDSDSVGMATVFSRMFALVELFFHLAFGEFPRMFALVELFLFLAYGEFVLGFFVVLCFEGEWVLVAIVFPERGVDLGAASQRCHRGLIWAALLGRLPLRVLAQGVGHLRDRQGQLGCRLQVVISAGLLGLLGLLLPSFSWWWRWLFCWLLWFGFCCVVCCLFAAAAWCVVVGCCRGGGLVLLVLSGWWWRSCGRCGGCAPLWLSLGLSLLLLSLSLSLSPAL